MSLVTRSEIVSWEMKTEVWSGPKAYESGIQCWRKQKFEVIFAIIYFDEDGF